MNSASSPVLQNYIDGEFVASSGTSTLDLVNPVDESAVGQAPISSPTDVTAARAFTTWGKTTPGARQAALLQLVDAIEAHSEEIVEAQYRNTGQPKGVIAAEKVAVSADHIRFFAGAARLLEFSTAPGSPTVCPGPTEIYRITMPYPYRDESTLTLKQPAQRVISRIKTQLDAWTVAAAALTPDVVTLTCGTSVSAIRLLPPPSPARQR